MDRAYHDTMDEIELALQEFADPNLTFRHFFSPGMYCREMTAPPGSVVTSKVHKTEHAFTLSAGMLTVRTEDGSEVTIQAPYKGQTTIGTRRIAYFHCESVWTTVHHIPWISGRESENEEAFYTAVKRIEEELIEDYQNKLLEGEFKNKVQCHLQQQPD